MRLGIAALAISILFHPLHTTHTELVETGGIVTIQVRAFSDDLNSAVTRKEGAVDDSALAHYLRGTITLTDSGGRPATLALTSKAIQGDITILQLRANGLTHLAGARISQLMHAELFSDQVNVVQASYDGRKFSLLFVPGDNPKRLP